MYKFLVPILALLMLIGWFIFTLIVNGEVFIASVYSVILIVICVYGCTLLGVFQKPDNRRE